MLQEKKKKKGSFVQKDINILNGLFCTINPSKHFIRPEPYLDPAFLKYPHTNGHSVSWVDLWAVPRSPQTLLPHVHWPTGGAPARQFRFWLSSSQSSYCRRHRRSRWGGMNRTGRMVLLAVRRCWALEFGNLEGFVVWEGSEIELPELASEMVWPWVRWN